VHKQEVIDYVGGLKDIEANEIHMIGEAKVRFKEDPVHHCQIKRALLLLNMSKAIILCLP
jgi:tRNA nucleotidyltransferase/poly(A) polymerase